MRVSTRWLAVYPRVCGGTRFLRSPALPSAGLSPRVRGNRVLKNARPHRDWSIPACAGEPCRKCDRPSIRRVYPRVCGGTDPAGQNQIPEFGLSPRVRGNPTAAATHIPTSRSIPACAGEPPRRSCRCCRPRVYPRVCGGTPLEREPALPESGLSPRVRGNPGREQLLDIRAGSIPACAGEPRPTASPAERPRVYPRVCGGTALNGQVNEQRRGLSPRVRGNRPRRPRQSRPARSIPACAGEPTTCPTRKPASKVYPRVCGGTGIDAIPCAKSPGLSPRVRGNQNKKSE